MFVKNAEPWSFLYPSKKPLKKRFKPYLSDSEKSGSRTRSQFEKVTLNHFLKALLVVDTVSKVTISNGHNFKRSQFIMKLLKSGDMDGILARKMVLIVLVTINYPHL